MESRDLLHFDPQKLDLVMRDEDFVVYYDNVPLVTPGGNETAHYDARLLRYMMTAMNLAGNITSRSVNAFSIFSYLKDYMDENLDPLSDRLSAELAGDVLFKSKQRNKKASLMDLSEVLEYLEHNPAIMNIMYWGVSMVMEGFREFMSVMCDENTDQQIAENPESALSKAYANLSPEKKAAINLLSMHHRNGVVLPVLLVQRHISPTEYAATTLAVHTNYRQGEAVRNFDVKGYQPQETQLPVNWKKPEEDFGRFIKDATCVREFLGYFSAERNKISVIRELIRQGEHDSLEFKSTFRWDIRQNKKNPAIEHAALKTMAAFLNSEGGDLLVGVEDDGNILGVETDGFVNDDKFLLHVWSMIKSAMGQEVSPYIKTTLEKFDSKTVCRVNCKKSPKPVFLRQKGFDEAFYIRSGPGTSSLDISEALKYINDRF